VQNEPAPQKRERRRASELPSRKKTRCLQRVWVLLHGAKKALTKCLAGELLRVAVVHDTRLARDRGGHRGVGGAASRDWACTAKVAISEAVN
jgi:hypothetical protein